MKVILIADICNDHYHFGSVDRLSPEAPVPVFKKESSETKGGMGLNVQQNFKVLGVDVSTYFGSISSKHRYIDDRSNYQLIRIDEESYSIPIHVNDIHPAEIFECDAIVISDYNKGFISDKFILDIIKKCQCPIFIDSKKTKIGQLINPFNENVFIKINKKEYEELVADVNCNLIVTLGKDGVLYNGDTFETKVMDVTDVCGAGDTFLASLVYNYIESKDIAQAIEFAMKASSVTIQKLGTYAPTLEEINNV